MRIWIWTFAFFVILVGCSEPAYRIHEKLDEILQSDLKYITAEVMVGSEKRYLLEEPYYKIVDLRFFQGDTARLYSGYAEVDFFYLKDIPVMQKRKYRYDARFRYWDRYFKKSLFLKKTGDSLQLVEK